MDKLEQRAREILNSLKGFSEFPASISGKYHYGETMEDHLTRVVEIIKDLCREFKVSEADTDMLSAAGWLHDIGRFPITKKGLQIVIFAFGESPGWQFFEKTGYSRMIGKMEEHPIIGSQLLEKFEIPRKKEIQRLIAIHMSHWYPEQPQPDTSNLFEVIICTADYLSSRKK